MIQEHYRTHQTTRRVLYQNKDKK